uniref:Fe2OG dioxygenase domain-containing protein n=1 Tax=viral metagenome TaxID=1070528 RepID=A0A6C0B6M3_9ZZZZ
MKVKSSYIGLCLILIFIIISFSILSTPHIETFAELGFADDNEEYIYPTVYNNFISPKEANYILSQAEPKFTDSETIGSGVDTQIRKSKTAWLSKNDLTIKNIIQRVCAINNYSIENAEDLQVVKYGPGGFYNPHHDSTGDDNKESHEFLKLGGHRIATMLIYLNDDFEGGATRFVNLAKDIKPPKHGSILFYPLDKYNNKCHPKALHAGLPLSSGQKYIANVWIRQKPFINTVD